ncbi:MAG: UvrD-helicase domain-containing protein [Pseudomonadota bacterium]|nr:UvrD-helicase domain-containing protein [Pseudomonadota bacterium]
MRHLQPSYLEGLNEMQQQGVLNLDGPVLMLAGAGTGKTRALTARIAHIINSGKAKPNQILAVTFTNKAAIEMKARISLFLGDVVEGMPWLGTFHSICSKMLRINAEIAGLNSDFTILDVDDQLRLLKQLIRLEKIDEKRWPPRSLAHIIDNWKNRALSPEKVSDTDSNLFDGNAVKLYTMYQDRLKTLNAVDFGDLLLHVLYILQKDAGLLEKYQSTFKYILVDEYQDTNVAQYLWLRLLAQKKKNICCVGDDDQSIYGWRGAEVGNILRFEKDFPDAKVFRLEQNYRSNKHILSAASNLIKANSSRLGKTLWTESKKEGKVRLVGHWNGEEEARWIGEEIEALARGTRGYDPVPLDEQVILVRASFQMRAFEERFVSIGLPYEVIGGPRFYERLEIRDAIAYLRIATSPTDSLAFERIINTPKRGLGERTVQELNKKSREKNLPLLKSARLAISDGTVVGKGKYELTQLLDKIDLWKKIISEDEKPPFEIAASILDESGYTEMWKNDNSPTSPGRLDNLKELIDAIKDFDNIPGFLEHISLMMENERQDGIAKLKIMTLHAAKGLEFFAVFLPGWEDGLFPSQRSLDETGLKGLEEERRLAYVGITRAIQHCTISFTANRRIYNNWQSAIPSRFLDNLSKEDVEVIVPPTLNQSRFAGNDRNVSRFGSQEFNKADNDFNSTPKIVVKNTVDKYQSPGLRRMATTNHLERSNISSKVPLNQATPSDLEIGEKVFHQKFGYGKVKDIDHDTATIEFKKAGLKKVKSGYLLSKGKLP